MNVSLFTSPALKQSIFETARLIFLSNFLCLQIIFFRVQSRLVLCKAYQSWNQVCVQVDLSHQITFDTHCFVQGDSLGCSSFSIMSFGVIWCKEIPTNKNEETEKDGVEEKK